jgi:hypothetical protein
MSSEASTIVIADQRVEALANATEALAQLVALLQQPSGR